MYIEEILTVWTQFCIRASVQIELKVVCLCPFASPKQGLATERLQWLQSLQKCFHSELYYWINCEGAMILIF